jgi:hypothetical protein
MRGYRQIVENAGEWLKIVVVIGISRSFLSSLGLLEIAFLCVLLCYPRVTSHAVRHMESVRLGSSPRTGNLPLCTNWGSQVAS